ncbi:hypothetical protein [Rhodanobacter ginsenosidimutans]|uniref:Uncharacterized protein n=1 Tax=Rhodanobacter ginsenosidimutans TaxID=490571 RepID=A0ABW0JVG7_9GAMM
MAIWELRCATPNDFAMLTPVDRDDLEEDVFDTTGTPKQWLDRPRVTYHVEKRRKVQKPQANVGLLIPGALVLDEKAWAALGGFLLRSGQLLELDCDGEPRWFYNVTRMVACVDTARSETFEDGGIAHEAFDESAVPAEPLVFKDPHTAPVRMYVNDAGKALIERMTAEAGLTGIECGEPGPL